MRPVTVPPLNLVLFGRHHFPSEIKGEAQMHIEMTPDEARTARNNWLKAGRLKHWFVQKFGTRFPSKKVATGRINTLYLFWGRAYIRSECVSSVDPMPPFSPDYVEGGRRS